MQTETNETAAATPDAELEMTDRDIAIAMLDEITGIRTALVSALQLVCSVSPFRGVIGVTDEGEIHQLPKGGK